MRRLLLFSILVGCGGEPAPLVLVEPPPAGLEATPRWLTYTCVEPGCDTTLKASVQVIGQRAIAVKRVVLSERDRTDFEFSMVERPPFVLEPGTNFEVEVRWRPSGDPRLGDVNLEVVYTDASASEEEARVDPGTLELPLVRRLVGEPTLEVTPIELVFGPVLVSARKTLPLTLANTGFGNVGLVIDRVDTSHEGILRVENLPTTALIPGDTHDLQVTYQPTEPAYLEGLLTVRPVGTSLLPTLVPVVATSIPEPRLAVEPEDGVDLGEIPVGSTGSATLRIQNQGAESLQLQSFGLASTTPAANILLTLPGGATTASIAPIRDVTLSINVEGLLPGEIDTNIQLASTDRTRPVLNVPLRGLITKPEVEISPGSVDFGAVPRGWTTVRTVQVTNVGYGDLQITNVGMILGSSELFTLRTVPTLPVTLRHAQRISLELEFRSEAEASFAGTLVVDSNDAETPFVEIGIQAQGASCELGCPIANGIPTCSMGICAVGSCNQDWFDTDNDPVNGCECREQGRDPGAFCADSIYLGSLSDEDGDRASFTGIIPTGEDEDVIRFHGRDDTGFFSDAFDVRVNLETTDPDLEMCVYRHDTAGHITECFFENETCGRSYRRDGNFGGEDGADFTVRIRRRPGAAATCNTYTVFMRNG